jgi:TonB family protein
MRLFAGMLAVFMTLGANWTCAQPAPSDSTLPPLIKGMSPPPGITAPFREPGAWSVPYPPLARRQNEQGMATVLFTVQEDGTVGDAFVEKSSGYTDLDDAAIASVKMWRFKPALKDDKPIAVRMETNMAFRLSDPDEMTDNVPHVDINMTDADYPREAIAAREEGEVRIATVILGDGRLIAAHIIKSSGSRFLDQASYDIALKRLHFIPASLDGKSFSTYTILVFHWHLPTTNEPIVKH